MAEKLEKTVAANNTLKGFVVFTNGDPAQLKKIAGDKNINNIAIAYLRNGADGNGTSVFDALKINKDAKNTILVYKKRRVVANFVNVDAEKFSDVDAAIKRMFE